MSGNLSRFCFQNMRNGFSISVTFPRKMCCFRTLNPRKMCKSCVIIPRKMCKFVEKNSLEWNEKPFSYWRNGKRWTVQTLDFVVQTPLRTIPIEVKAEENVRAKSLKTYVERHPEYGLKGLRISMLGYENQTWMEHIPLYGIQKYFASCTPQVSFSPRKACG